MRSELAFVARVAFFLVLAAGAVIAVQRGAARGLGSDPYALTGEFQGSVVAFAELAPAEQRLVRAIQEGEIEAENGRSRGGSWPDVNALAAEGVPPFAPDPIDREGYGWVRLQDGLLTNYVGAPRAGSLRPAFLVLIQEPPPGLAKDPRARTDEVHHRLADGTLVHVSIWIGPPLGVLTAPLGNAPVEKGWKRVALARSSS